MRELIVDSFAGGGGASTGIEMALGRSPAQGGSDIQIVRLGGHPYVTLTELMELQGEDPAHVVLQRSLDDELAPARELERTVLGISLAVLLVVVVVAFAIARGISRPLQELAAHTKLVAAGDYSQSITLPRDDELGQLASAFNHMTAGLAERDRVRNEPKFAPLRGRDDFEKLRQRLDRTDKG